MLKIMNVLDDVKGLQTAYRLDTAVIKLGIAPGVTTANQILVLK